MDQKENQVANKVHKNSKNYKGVRKAAENYKLDKRCRYKNGKSEKMWTKGTKTSKVHKI